MYEMGTDAIARLRFGIRQGEDFEKKRAEEGFSLADYVLSGFDEKEQDALEKTVEAAKDAVISFIDRGITETMNSFNRNVLIPKDLNTMH